MPAVAGLCSFFNRNTPAGNQFHYSFGISRCFRIKGHRVLDRVDRTGIENCRRGNFLSRSSCLFCRRSILFVFYNDFLDLFLSGSGFFFSGSSFFPDCLFLSFFCSLFYCLSFLLSLCLCFRNSCLCSCCRISRGNLCGCCCR